MLGEKLEPLLASTRALRLRAIDPRLVEWERNRVMAIDGLRAVASLGLLGLEVPVSQGGLGGGFRDKIAVARLFSETSMPFAFSMVNTANLAMKVARDGTDAHRAELLDDLLAGRRIGSTALTEPGAGSDFAAISTSATRAGDTWVLHGEKAWITNAATSDVLLVYAQTEPGSGARGIASFLVDGRRPGVTRVEPYQLSGAHLIGTGGFRFDGYVADTDDLLSPPGSAFKAALASVSGARTYVAAMCCAMVRAALSAAVRYGVERTAFGVSLLEHQGLAWTLADVANRLEAAELLTERAVAAIEQGDDRAAILPAAHAKKFATEMAEPAIAACIQAMGAEGLREEHQLGAQLAAARVTHFVDGSTQIQTDRIAHSLRQVYT